MANQPILGRLISLPTPETVRRFMDIFQCSPVHLDPFGVLHVTIARSYSPEQDIVLQKVDAEYPDSVFNFKFINLDYFFDEALAVSKLLGDIDCRPLADLRAALEPNGPDLSMQFLHNAPPLSRAIRSFVVSIADVLCLKETKDFTLQNIFYVSEDQYRSTYKAHYLGFDDQGFRESV